MQRLGRLAADRAAAAHRARARDGAVCGGDRVEDLELGRRLCLDGRARLPG